MDFQHLLAMMGMGELLVDDFFAAQIGFCSSPLWCFACKLFAPLAPPGMRTQRLPKTPNLLKA